MGNYSIFLLSTFTLSFALQCPVALNDFYMLTVRESSGLDSLPDFKIYQNCVNRALIGLNLPQSLHCHIHINILPHLQVAMAGWLTNAEKFKQK